MSVSPQQGDTSHPDMQLSSTQLSSVCNAIETSTLGQQIVASTWMWPAIETVHVAAMVALVASICTFDLRLLGLLLRHLPVSQVADRLLPSTWGAFGIMVLTGTLLFAPQAARNYCYNPAMRIKLILILLAGVNMALFHFTIYRNVSKWDSALSTPLSAKLIGSISVILWASVVIAGRLIGFVEVLDESAWNMLNSYENWLW
jgi:hypothetical protein